jgi:hypothetical protein
MSKLIELLDRERFREANALAEAAAQVQGGVEPLQSGLAGAVIIKGQGEAELLEGQQALPRTRIEIEVLVFADLQPDLVGFRPPQSPGTCGRCRRSYRQGGGSQADLPGRLRLAISLALSLTKPWPSASGRCRTTGAPILCSKRSSRVQQAFEPGDQPFLARPAGLQRFASQREFAGKFQGKGAGHLDIPGHEAGAVPGRGGAGS